MGLKGRGRLGRAVPVAAGHARARHPDLAYLVGRAATAGVRIDDYQKLLARWRSRRHKGNRARALGRSTELTFFQSTAIRRDRDWRLLLRPSRNEQRRLGQTVTRHDDVFPQPRARECRGEARERIRTHRLRAVERGAPRREVEGSAFLRRRAFDAEIVGEVRRTAQRCPVARHRLEPEHRALNEARRRHEDCGQSGVDWLDDAGNQPHVVERREPEDELVVRPMRADTVDDRGIVEQVRVRQHHAARITG